MTVRLKEKKQAVTVKLKQKAQEDTAQLVQKHSAQMLELLKAKQEEIKHELQDEFVSIHFKNWINTFSVLCL